MLGAPGVQQGIPGAGIVSDQWRSGIQQGHVRYPANVDDSSRLRWNSERIPVEGWHERRALAAQCHISAPEITYNGEPGARGNQCGIAKLDGCACRSVGGMEHGLSVAPDGPDGLPVNRDVRQYVARRCREFLRNADVESGGFGKRSPAGSRVTRPSNARRSAG